MQPRRGMASSQRVASKLNSDEGTRTGATNSNPSRDCAIAFQQTLQLVKPLEPVSR